MTSDAKIGLLLGLVFIFIIAFVINGLPILRNNKNNNELTTNMTIFDNNSLGIGNKERKAQQALNWMELLEKRPFGEAQASVQDGQEIRSVIPLPQNTFVAEAARETADIQPETTRLRPSSVSTKEAEEKEPKPTNPAWPKVYVIKEGDNLSTIAMKFYGSEQGNKRINVNMIFEANRKLMSSPDEIYVGQKLIIPAPSDLTKGEKKIDSVLSNTLFEKVNSIGKKHLSIDDGGAKQGRWYVVKEGDNLWKIATEQLGSGNRYAEIRKLNAGILADEDSLAVGMRLKVPAQ